ncbi:MAG TPA: PHP domain-containing protein [Methanosarcinales archaeon]|nr:PHP domain-containing protein [Methanosarcinales archaeon]
MRFDLHIHSMYSRDSRSPIDSILKHAMDIGLDGIAICDHDTAMGGVIGEERAEELGLPLIVIPGIEITTTKGHIIALGVRTDIPPKETPQETIAHIRELGGVVVVPHPFKRLSHGIGDFSDLDVDAVEIFNSRFITGEANRKAERMALEMGIPAVAGSDAHAVMMIGYAVTEIAAESSQQAVLDAIRNGKTRVYGKRTPIKFFAAQMIRGWCRRVKEILGIRVK